MSPYDKASLFGSGSEMSALMAAEDWSATPVGAVEEWPQSLRAIVRAMLTSRFAMWMGWGPELTFFYNDAYAAMTLGTKHPWALGKPSREVWAEIWPEIGPRIDRVLSTGQATWDERLQLFLERSGFQEETYHTFSYSPVADDVGHVTGHLCVVTEETERVIAERRMALLRDTASAIASSITESEVLQAVTRVLTGSLDLPFTLTYLLDVSDEWTLASSSGMPDGHPVSQTQWPTAGVSDTLGVLVDLRHQTSAPPPGPWQRPPTHALVLRMADRGRRGTSGYFVAGLNPFRPLDDGCRSFVRLLVDQISNGLATAHAYAEERQRAAALAELDRAKTAFFSNVSHEFRTPLTLMLGPLEDALDSPRRALEHDDLSVVHRNAMRLLKLVNTLLEFSRIEAGRVRARFEPVDLARLTAELASTFRSAMLKAGLDYRVECEPLGEPVYVDREMWEKVVLNLLSNAFKFTLSGAIRVTLEARGGSAVLSVSDTGVGIPEHELPRMFERFHRIEVSSGRSHEGSGIGLAFVHELVKLHGGALSVQSTLGEGSTFTVEVPFGTRHLPAEYIGVPADATTHGTTSSYVQEALGWIGTAEPSAKSVVIPTTSTTPHQAHVLLVDDNADMLEYGRRLLAERWRVTTARDGIEALEAARTERPDVIVTDVMMPRLDGFGLLRAVRDQPELKSVPVIMLSARAGEEARLEGLAATADDYLVKPFSARDLLGRVDAQIARARMRALEQSYSRRLARIFASAPVAIAILRGPDHVFELTNPRYDELIGDRNVQGQPIAVALPEVEEQGIVELLDRVRSSGEPYIGRSVRITLNRGADGAPEECAFDFVYQPILDDDGYADSIIVVASDVTALARARDDAESASRLKDEFLATVSHELRTPLNAVLGYIQMIRAGLIDDERRPSVFETIERNAKLQAQLISDILDVSRIITGKLRLDIRPVDLGQVIRDAIDTVSPTALAKGVRIQAALDQPGVPVAGDAQRLQQVVWNLLANAIKFTPRGGRVHVRLARVNSHVEVTVSDTGEGISPEHLPYLFERFRQADGGFARAHGGLGLGLAICRHLVEAHGGEIFATSPGRGHGTTLRVELPLMIVHAEHVNGPDRVHPTAEEIASERVRLANLSGRRVLLVDDDADALAMARDALTAAGALVVTASAASAALSALDQQHFDAAILDIGLPEIDGFELLKRIRSRPNGRHGTLPVAALTAYARPADRARSLQAGFQLHLSKPVQPTELTAAVIALTGWAPSN